MLATIASTVYEHDSEERRTICYFNDKPSACDFGMACGGLSMIVAVIFSVLDCAAGLQQYTEPAIRRLLHGLGLVVSGILSVLWLSGFAYMYVRSSQASYCVPHDSQLFLFYAGLMNG